MPASQRSFPAFAAFACFVLAAKFLLIAHFGSATPDRDEWAEEGYYFMAPLANGTLPASAWFTSHYEHRQVMTRLLDALLLAANGEVWSPLLEMVVNAFLHLGALLVLLIPLYRLCPPASRRHFMVAATLIATLPFSYENTLCGYQSQVYFMLLFGFLFLRGMCFSAPLSAAWWLALGAGVLAFFSFGGAVAALAAGATVLLLRAAGNRDGRTRLAAALACLLCFVAVLLTPATPVTAQSPHADSAATFLGVWWRINSWPLLPLAPLVQWPLLRFTLRQLRGQQADTPAHWFLVAAGLWTFAMSVLLAFGRGHFALASRYTDYFALNILFNYLCLLLTPQHGPRRLRQAWVIMVTLGLLLQGTYQFAQLTEFSAPRWQDNEQRYAAYLRTGDFSYLSRNDFPQVALSPGPDDMKLLLDDPAMRPILPPVLLPANASRENPLLRDLIASLHPLAILLLTAGVVLLLVRRRPEDPQTA